MNPDSELNKPQEHMKNRVEWMKLV